VINLVTISVITEKKSSLYRGFGKTFMRGFIIVYFDIRPLISQSPDFSTLLFNIIQSSNFVGEDLPAADGAKVLNFLEENCAEIIDVYENKVIYIMEDSSLFLEFFEKILSSRLKKEVSDLLKKYGR